MACAFTASLIALAQPARAQGVDDPPGFQADVQGGVQAEAKDGATATSGTTTTTVEVGPSEQERAPADAERPPIAGEASASAGAQPRDVRKAQLRRVSNTWYGPAGGIHVVDAGSGNDLGVRLQLAMDMFSTSDYLLQGDIDDYFGGTLSLGISVMEHLEVYTSLHSHANGNTMERPQLLQVLGDWMLGAKGYYGLTPFLTVGGDLRLVFLNAIGTVGPVLKSTSVGIRGLFSADLRELPDESVPLIARASFDYYIDNSSLLVEDVEIARYGAIPADEVDPPATEDQHLIRRVERFALGVNRMDMFTIGLGLEVPLLLDGTEEEGWFLHPITELTIGIPVNRQSYSCLLVATDTGRSDPDGCLDVEGFAAMPSTFTLGARLFPPKVPLSFLIGLDIGVSGASTFVRELAPNKPWAFLLAVSYAVDEGEEPEPKVVVVEREPPPPPPPPVLPRIAGVVVDKASGAGIPRAIVQYVGRSFTPQATNVDGSFLSYELEAGPIVLSVTHPDYEPGECSVTMPGPTAAGAAPVAPPAAAPPAAAPPPPPPTPPGGLGSDGQQLNPYLYQEAPPAAAPVSPAPSVPAADGRVPLRCELKAKPRAGSLRGDVVGIGGKPVAGAQVMVTGPTVQSTTSDAAGAFVVQSLPAGNYSVRVEAETYLLKIVNVDVAAEQQASVRVEMVDKPATAQVELTKEEVRIRKQIFFKSNSAEISETSNALLTEIADVILRNPQVTSIEIQGHTDGLGTPEANLVLSQNRADAVRTWLINAGVAADRLTATGYGDNRPLMPNITERARALNRRVQFMIK